MLIAPPSAKVEAKQTHLDAVTLAKMEKEGKKDLFVPKQVFDAQLTLKYININPAIVKLLFSEIDFR